MAEADEDPNVPLLTTADGTAATDDAILRQPVVRKALAEAEVRAALSRHGVTAELKVPDGALWSIYQAILHIERMRTVLGPQGWGLGLAGSVLTAGWSAKDLDVLIFPHDSSQSRTSSPELARGHLERIGMRRRYEAKQVRATWKKRFPQSNDGKHVEIWEDHLGRRVDLFFMR